MRKAIFYMAIVVLFPALASAGIPEPGLTMYGAVINSYDGHSVRLTAPVMTLRWTITPSGGTSVLFTTPLSNINDQYSHALVTDWETVVTGFPLSTNHLELKATTTSYTRSNVKLRFNSTDYTATIQAPAGNTFTFSRTDRAAVEQVNLAVSFTPPDADGDGLPDYWEAQFFGDNSANPNDDPDNDGLTNWEEYLAGSDPTNDRSLAPPPLSPPTILSATPYNTVVDLRWTAVTNAKGYSLYRGTQSGGPFSKIGGTYLTGTFYRDCNLVNDITYFYLMKSVNDILLEGTASNEVSAMPSAGYGVTPVTDLVVIRDGNDISFDWTEITTGNGTNFYRLYRVYPPTFDKGSGEVIAEPMSPTFNHVDAYGDGQVYYYTLITVDDLEMESNN